MSKKISAVVLLVMLINLFGQCMVSSAEQDNKISIPEEFCFENKFFDKTDYNADAIVSRGEFTEILAKIAGLNVVAVEQDKWSEYVYEGSVQEGDGTLFNDVDTSHPYYASIKAVVDAKYMKGISDKLFAPDVNMTVKQAYTVFLNMINYEELAYLEGGYGKIASNLDLTKGVTVSDSDYISYKNLATLIYNLLDVESYNYRFTETKTFMNDILDMKVVQGMLTDNGYTSITGPSEIKDSCIKVGDTIIKVPVEKEYMRNYIGTQVKVYYTYDESDEENNTAVYMITDMGTESFTFDSSDFQNYTGTSIKYLKNGKSKNITLTNIQYMIYNNEAVKTFDKNTFLFGAGEITVIPESYNGKSLIIINSIEYAYVNHVDTKRNEIHNKLNAFDDVLVLDNYEDVTITDAEGAEKQLSDIAQGNILEVVRNSDRINIKVTTITEKNFYVNGVEDNDKNTQTIHGDNDTYDLSSQYFKDKNKIKIEPGKFYDIYLTSKNEIIWAELRTGDFQVGYLIRTAYDPDTQETAIIVSNMDGNVIRVDFAEKFTINDRKGERHRNPKEETIKEVLVGQNDLIRYTLNKDGFLNYIELPMDKLPDTNDRLHKIVDADDTSKWGGTRYPYQRGSLGFGGALGTVSTVKVLKVPNSANIRDYTKYKKTTLAESFVGSDNSRRFIAYTTKRNTFAAEYIIAKSYENEVPALKDKRDFFVVDEITTAVLDEFDTVGMKITGYLVYGTKSDVAKKEMTLYCDDTNYDVVEKMPDLYHSTDKSGKVNEYKLQSGDIIRLAYDETNTIQVAELVFRHTLAHPGSKSTKGTLAGSIGYYDEKNVYSNPVVIDENGNLKAGVAKYIVGTDFRLAMSWVNDKVEDVYQVTTQDLSESAFDPAGGNGKYMIDIMGISPTSMILVEYENGKVSEIRAATAQDIRTKVDAGSRCSRIIHNWYWGTGLHGFVINGL